MTDAVELQIDEEKGLNLIMIKQKVVKIIYYSIFFVLTINISVIGVAHSTEFEIDEIITAIKNEIKTANISELGSPNFKIETVDVSLSVVSTETEKGALAVKIVGYGSEVDNDMLTYKSYHNLSFSFQPTGASGFSPEISLGLVEPITKVKSSFRKAYNTPPSFQMEGFTFKLEFAIEKGMDGGIRFKVIALEDLKALNVTTHYITIHMKIKR
jgi:hypothetical protein